MSMDLLDYRRRMAEAYADLRRAADPERAAARFRQWKDDLFRTHGQSPIEMASRAGFDGLGYFPYDPAFRVLAVVEPVPEQVLTVPVSEGDVRLLRFAQAVFTLPTGEGRLDLYWISGYGGGVFLPFSDTTRGRDTYGGGRYLLDTIKGADLGTENDRLVLDFNLAYQPSCAYSPRWVCPLAPAANRLGFAVPVGERYVDLTA